MQESTFNGSEHSSSNNNNNIAQIILRYLSMWPYFLISIVLCLLASFLFIQFAIPVYECTATILLKDESDKNESKLLEALDMFASKKLIENEIEVLRSRMLMREVVRKKGLYAPIFRKGKVRTLSAYMESPVNIELQYPDTLTEVKNIPFSYDQDNKRVLVSMRSYPLNAWIDFGYGNMRFVPNPRCKKAAKKNEFFFSLVDVKKIVTSILIDHFDVTASSKTATILDLKLEDDVPQRGEDILNELIKVYNQNAIEDKNILAGNAVSFLDERLHSVVAELDSVEHVLQMYKVNKGVTDISEQGSIFLKGVEYNDQKVSEINVQLAVLDQVEKYLQGTQDHGIVPSTIGLNDAILSGLLQQLYQLEIQYEKLRKTTAENNPLLLSLQDQIKKIKPGILQNIANQRINMEAARGNLSVTNGKYNSMLRTIPQKERELLEISRQQSIKNNIYTFLLQKREEAALSFAAAVSDSRLVDYAESSQFPVKPKKALIYLIAFFVAITIEAAIIYIRDLLSPNINFRSEIKSLISLPIIGEIPYDFLRRQIVIKNGEKSYIAEQFRGIRTSLSYLGFKTGKKKILITSPVPGEGKTFVASNLAISLALMKKRVLLIELDLRKPRLSEVFNVYNDLGMSELLSGDARIEQVLVNSKIDPNLVLILSGEIPSNPSELILNGKLNEILDELGKEFDYIIMETAPVTAVTDALIISEFCDVSLYVIRQGYTPNASLKILKDNIEVIGLHNAAIIFNGVKKTGKKGYGYGYAYGNNEGPAKKRMAK